jgi:hypothetical protein
MARRPCGQDPPKASVQDLGDGGDRVGDPQGAARRIGDVEPILRNIDADAQGARNSGKIG